MRDFGRCEKIVNDLQVTLKEKRSKIIFLNRTKKDVRVIEIDGCVITEGLRCDYLVISTVGTEHFVELKGNNINHAVKQVERTVIQVSTDPKLKIKYSFIISSRCPLLTTKIQNLKLMFKKKYNSVLIIKNVQYVHEI